MNILLVTNLFPTPTDPERGVFTLQLVKRLKKICNVTVVCPLPYFPKISLFKKLDKWYQFALVPGEYEIEGVKVYSPKYPLIPKLSEAKHAYFMSLGLKSCIRRLNDEIKFDVINSQWLFPDSCAVDLAIESLNIPHVPTGLGCDVNLDLYHSEKGPRILSTLNNAAAITVVSNSLKNELVNSNLDEHKITVIPNGVDIENFKPLNKSECREKLDLLISTPMLLYVGRLSEEKDVKSLILAAEKAIETDALHLYIVGDGPLMGELKELTAKLKISEYVHFIGKVNHLEVSTWMGATDFFCLPSLREGCPNVILEALGCGRPVIASRVGAIPDVVNEDTGILFAPQNIDEISQSISQAFSKNWDEKTISESIKNLSWEHAAKNYYDVFKHCSTE
ncbi:MAG: glycosyltransferase [Methylococcales bacterium]